VGADCDAPLIGAFARGSAVPTGPAVGAGSSCSISRIGLVETDEPRAIPGARAGRSRGTGAGCAATVAGRSGSGAATAGGSSNFLIGFEATGRSCFGAEDAGGTRSQPGRTDTRSSAINDLQPMGTGTQHVQASQAMLPDDAELPRTDRGPIRRGAKAPVVPSRAESPARSRR
jgi:hypothetical protein